MTRSLHKTRALGSNRATADTHSPYARLLKSITAGLIASCISTSAALAQTSAEIAHRPLDALNGFLEGCMTANNSTEHANAAFGKYDLTIGISNRPTGDFPAAIHYGKEYKHLALRGLKSDCRVRVRALWLSSFDPVVVSHLRSLGWSKTKSYPAKERRKGVGIEHGNASGLYSWKGRTFAVIVAQTKQRGGRLTELQISELTPR